MFPSGAFLEGNPLFLVVLKGSQTEIKHKVRAFQLDAANLRWQHASVRGLKPGMYKVPSIYKRLILE